MLIFTVLIPPPVVGLLFVTCFTDPIKLSGVSWYAATLKISFSVSFSRHPLADRPYYTRPVSLFCYPENYRVGCFFWMTATP
jgi:hypothetical protein